MVSHLDANAMHMWCVLPWLIKKKKLIIHTKVQTTTLKFLHPYLLNINYGRNGVAETSRKRILSMFKFLCAHPKSGRIVNQLTVAIKWKKKTAY